MNKTLAKQKFYLNGFQQVLVVLGGSQGSVPLNHHFKQQLDKYLDSSIQILWQCGQNEYEALQASIDKPGVHLIPFSNDMGALYSAADLIVSRAGALALSEMALVGKAMVLIPFPHSAGDHQTMNAKAFSNSGAAELIPQSNLEKGDLETTVLDLLHQPRKIKAMEQKSLDMAVPDATEKIVEVIMELAES